MFSWRRTKKSSSYEPKTPKMTNISLPDERYVVPPSIYRSYTEKPHKHDSYSRDFIPNKRASTPLVQPNTYHHDAPSMRSRPRTVSTPVREVEAPRPIRPHPSQGPFLPNHRDRIDPSHLTLAPVGGEPFFGRLSSTVIGVIDPRPVPSAAFLEEQLRRQRTETRTAPQAHSNMIDVSDYVYPEETKLREVAKRTGATVTTQHSKAYLESLEDEKRERERVKAPSAPPIRRSSSNTRERSREPEKVICDFDDYKPVPVEAAKPGKKVPGAVTGPLKSALKKTTTLPTAPLPLKSAMKKSDHGHNNAYLSEPETPQRTTHRGTSRSKRDPILVPSKAYLEDQQEKLEAAAAQRQASLTSTRPTVHEIRPSAFAPTHSSSTGSSPSDYAQNTSNPYDTSRSRRGSYVDPRTVSSSYVNPFIREIPVDQWGRRINPQPVHPAPRPTNPPTHVPLTWPLVDFSLRNRQGYPLLYFDTAFNPRMPRYPIKLKRGLDTWPLSEEEKEMPAGLGMHVTEMWIIHKSLPKWPVHIKLKRIRVIDVFMWIYDDYALPLTAQELMEVGPDYLNRCRPFFEQRCRDSPSWQHLEEMKGILRVDLLRGKRIFKGIQPVPGRPATYELLLD